VFDRPAASSAALPADAQDGVQEPAFVTIDTESTLAASPIGWASLIESAKVQQIGSLNEPLARWQMPASHRDRSPIACLNLGPSRQESIMGILDALMGHGSEVAAKEVAGRLEGVLLPDETAMLAFRLFRDFFAFTEKRLIIVEIQGVTGRKVEYLTIPYRSITRYSLETVGTFDTDAELKIWISGDSTPIERTLGKGTDIPGIQLALAAGVLN
jgi:hypothetical protein